MEETKETERTQIWTTIKAIEDLIEELRLKLDTEAILNLQKEESTILKSALKTLSEQCNSLVEEQTRLLRNSKEQEKSLISDLAAQTKETVDMLKEQVRQLPSKIDAVLHSTLTSLQTCLNDIKAATESDEKIKSQLPNDIEKMTNTTASKLSKYIEQEIDEPLKKAKTNLDEFSNKAKWQKNQIRRTGVFGTIILIATPFLLVLTCVFAVIF